MGGACGRAEQCGAVEAAPARSVTSQLGFTSRPKIYMSRLKLNRILFSNKFKISLCRISPLEFRSWQRFLLRGEGALLARRSPSPLKSPNSWHAQGASLAARVKFIIGLQALNLKFHIELPLRSKFTVKFKILWCLTLCCIKIR